MVGAAADTVAQADATAAAAVGVNPRLLRRLARACEEIRTEPMSEKRFGERRDDRVPD
jgi:hypothetical protein